MLVFDSSAIADRLTFAPDNSALVAVWRSGQVDVRGLPDGSLRHSFPPPPSATIRWRRAVVHPACRVAFRSTDDSPAVLDLETGEVRASARNDGSYGYMSASACGGWLIGFRADAAQRIVGFRCTADGELRAAWEVDPLSRYESPGGFVTGGAFVCVDSNRRKLVVRDAATGEVRREVAYPSFHQGERVASPDGRRFAAMGYDKLYVWDAETWEMLGRFPTGGRRFSSLAFHPTRPTLAAITSGQTLVKYLDPQAGKMARKFNWKLGEALAVGFSPDGALAAAAFMGKIVVWDVDE